MARGVRGFQAELAIVERHAAASVASLHLIRARTSRVLAATSAFTTLRERARSVSQVVGELTTLEHVDDESVDRSNLARELTQLRTELYELRLRFARELAEGAEAECAPRASRREPWWRRWWC